MSRCPTNDQLEEFLEESGSDANRSAVARHVEGCGRCQARLEEFTSQISLSKTSVIVPDLDAGEQTPISHNSQTAFLARLKKNPPSLGGKDDKTTPTPDIQPGTLSPCPAPFPVIANYEILGELGRGGMGVIYKARQVGLDRLVALKMILAGPYAERRDLVRFRQEAEAVARLQHPNIIQIYDIGESNGCPFLALEFVEGHTLADLLRGAPQPHRLTARLVEILARAMHYAHQRNILHRDLKPANVLMANSDQPSTANDHSLEPSDLLGENCLLNANPKITDFGLAKRLDETENSTQTGVVVGTPSYMAPEQAASTGAPVGPAADVYALGAILYELLTGRPPFRGPTSLETVIQVLHEDPVRPSYLRPGLPGDLETICLKCLAKEPAKRYASAEDLADDMHRFRKGQPIKARPIGPLHRAWKWARHRPMSASLIVGIVLVTVLGFAAVTWEWRAARLARDNMEIQREEAVKARQQAGLSLYYIGIGLSQLQWRNNDIFSARKSLADCQTLPDQEDHRGWEWHYLQGLFHNELFTLSHAHNGLGGSVAYDPKGRRIISLVSAPPVDESPELAEIRSWDARTGELLNVQAVPAATHRLAIHPSGNRFALAGTDGVVMIWDAIDNKEILRRPMHDQNVAAIAFSPDGRFVVSAGEDRIVKMWDSGTGEVLQEFHGHEQAIQSVAIHPTKPLIASGSWDTTAKIWDTTTGKEIKTLRGHPKVVYCVAFSPDGQTLVSAGGNGNLKLWSLDSYQVVQSLTGETGAVLDVAFSPDGRYLAKAGRDGTVRIWHLTTGVERMAFRGHSTPVESVHFSPDCQRVVSNSPGDGAVKVWDLTRHAEFATFARTDADVEAVSFGDEGRHLISITNQGKLQAWDASTGMLLDERQLALNKEVLSPAVPVSFSPEGKSLAGRSEHDPKVIQVWDTATGAETASYRGHTLPIYCVRFTSDARHLLSCACSPDRPAGKAPANPVQATRHEVKVWDVNTGICLVTMSGIGRIFNLAACPNSTLLAWGGQEGAIFLADWRAERHKGPDGARLLQGHRGDVSGLAFSPDGKLLATAGMEDRTVKIWHVDDLSHTGSKAWRTLGAPNLIGDLAFSSDGLRLAAISRDMVKMWDTGSGHEALTLRGASQRYWDPLCNPRLAFSPDGTQLAGSNWDKSISIWEAPPLDNEEQFVRFQEKRRRFADERSNFWHLQEAELCLDYKNVPAARYHLQRLQKDLLTGPLQSRLDRVEARIKE